MMNTGKTNYMAVDQYGQTYHNLGEHPRKTLMDRLCRKHVSKIYVDGRGGELYHVGYVISGLWLSLYEVTPMRKVVA